MIEEDAVRTLHLLLGNLGATTSSVQVVTTKGGGTEASNEGQTGSSGHCKVVCRVVGVVEIGVLYLKKACGIEEWKKRQGAAVFV